MRQAEQAADQEGLAAGSEVSVRAAEQEAEQEAGRGEEMGQAMVLAALEGSVVLAAPGAV
jgi:hypothetical protein